MIVFPSASTLPKLSSCPSSKLPEAYNWVHQDFLGRAMNGECCEEWEQLFPQQGDCLFSKHDLGVTLTTDDTLLLPDLNNSSYASSLSSLSDLSYPTSPVLIESSLSSSCTTSESSSHSAMSFQYYPNPLNKRKSTSSFSSFKSFMNVFHSNKRIRLDNVVQVTPSSRSPTSTSSVSKKVLKYMKRCFRKKA